MLLEKTQTQTQPKPETKTEDRDSRQQPADSSQLTAETKIDPDLGWEQTGPSEPPVNDSSPKDGETQT